MFFSMPVCRKPMLGRTDTTVSPSSSITRRMTPWVLGCWGPTLMTIVSSVLSRWASTIWSQSAPLAR